MSIEHVATFTQQINAGIKEIARKNGYENDESLAVALGKSRTWLTTRYTKNGFTTKDLENIADLFDIPDAFLLVEACIKTQRMWMATQQKPTNPLYDNYNPTNHTP